MFRGSHKEFQAPGGQTCGETLNRDVGVRRYARFTWQAWDKSRNRNVGRIFKLDSVILFLTAPTL